MKSVITDLKQLQRRRFLVDMLMLGCAVLAFGWIPAALVLIFRDVELRQQVLHILWYLWPLAFFPFCCFGFFWCWRSSLNRKIEKMDFHDTSNKPNA